MERKTHLWVFAALAVVGLGACDQLGLGPRQAASQPAAPAVQPIADMRPHVGAIYSDFAAAAGARYSPEQLGLNATDRARLWRAMAHPVAGRMVQGGGAEALVFRGCAEESCQDGIAVVAVDVATGGAFAAVHDAGGAIVLIPNDRVEALLRLNSPSRRWDDPAPEETASIETAHP